MREEPRRAPLRFSCRSWTLDHFGLDDDDVVGAFLALLGGAEETADDAESSGPGHAGGGEADAFAEDAAGHDCLSFSERDGGLEAAVGEAQAVDAVELAGEVAEGALDVEGGGAVGGDERHDLDAAAEVDRGDLVFDELDLELAAAIEVGLLVVVDADAELVDGAGEALFLEGRAYLFLELTALGPSLPHREAESQQHR